MITRDPRPDARPTWQDLSIDEQIDELRLESASTHYDEFRDDPCAVAHCPEHGAQVITAYETHCDECGRDLYNLRPVTPYDNYRERWAA